MFSRLYHSYNKSQLDLTLNCLESEFNSRFDSHLKKCPFDLLWSFRTEGNLQMSHRIRVQARTQLSMADDHHLKFLSGRHGPWNNDPATVCVHVLPLKKSHYWDPCPFTWGYPRDATAGQSLSCRFVWKFTTHISRPRTNRIIIITRRSLKNVLSRRHVFQLTKAAGHDSSFIL